MSWTLDRAGTVGALGGVVLAGAALGNVVTLENGRRFEGVAIEEGEEVSIDTVVAGIRTKLTYKQGDVASVEHEPVPDGFSTSRSLRRGGRIRRRSTRTTRCISRRRSMARSGRLCSRRAWRG